MKERNYNFRKHNINRIVKAKILRYPFAYGFYRKSHSSRHRKVKSGLNLQDPEDKWFNYIGEYKKYFDKSNNRFTFGRHKKNWKAKDGIKRSRFKELTRDIINDEIREKYYYCY